MHRHLLELYLKGAEKIAFPPKPDIRTDISNYRVASLLKRALTKFY